MAAVEDVYEVHLGMIRCFRERLKQTIAAGQVLDYLTFLSNEEKEEIRAKEKQMGNAAGAELLLSVIEQKPLPQGWFPEFVTALRETLCTGALQYVDPKDLPPPSLEAENDVYLELVSVFCPRIIDQLEEEQAERCFQEKLCSKDDYEHIMACFRQGLQRQGARELLNRIVQKRDWFSPFLVVLRETNMEDLANELSGNVETTTDAKVPNPPKAKAEPAEAETNGHASLDNSSKESLVLSELDVSLPSTLDTSLESNLDLQSDSDLEEKAGSKPRASPEPKIMLRDYQMEVARPALHGENVLICQPTGSGKIAYEVHLGMIRCFRERLKQTIAVVPVLNYLTFLSNEEKDEIRAKEKQMGNAAAAVLLLRVIEEKPQPQSWFPEFVTALRQTMCTGALQYVDPKGLPPPSLEAENDVYLELVSVFCPRIIDQLEEEQAERCFQKKLCSKDGYEQVMACFRQGLKRQGARELLNRIVQKRDWFSQFLVVLQETNMEELANELSGNVETTTDAKIPNTPKAKAEPAEAETNGHESLDNSSEESLVLSELDASLPSTLDTSLESNLDLQSESDLEEAGSKPRVSPEPKIMLRDYQMEVARPALHGENVLICLPTGSGKTRVAVYITKQHLDAKKENPVPGKVIVLVNRVPLVEQHYRKEFYPHLKHWYTVTKLSGDSPLKISFPEVVRESDIILCTAQILENSLCKASKGEDGVQLSDFSLLIIDECHHTQKEAVYNNIMIRYIKLKMKNKKLSKENLAQVHLPQILGLTASPGVGGANSAQKAEEHILNICANLDANRIMTVQTNIDQLNNQVKEPSKTVDTPDETRENPFKENIIAIMTEIQQHCGLAPTSEFGTQSYEQWAVQKEKTAAKESNRKERVCAEHLKKYNDALIINNTIRMIDAYDHLKNFYDEERKRKLGPSLEDEGSAVENIYETDTFLIELFDKSRKELKSVAKNPKYENETLKQLRRHILEAFTKNEEARGIIFTKTRQSTVALLQWIKENPKFEEVGVKPDYLIGAGSTSKFKPMTQNAQKEVLNKFRVGKVNLLVATNVAEEGLDINKCNMVIRYETVTNEIGMVQARGRVRDADGTYVLLASSSSGVHEREKVNEYREKMMYTAIENVQKMTPEEYTRKIQKFQMQSVMEKNMKAKKKNCKKYTENPSMVSFHCRDCNVLVCTGEEIQVIETMHRVIVSPEFKDRFLKRQNKTLQGKLADYQTNGEIFCKSCTQQWGTMMVHHGLDLPCLKIRFCVVAFKDQKNSRHSYEHWSELAVQFPPFEIGDLDISDDYE